MAEGDSRAAAVKHGLPPIAAPDARLLILGSLPGERSLAAERYYAHPQNQFWRLLEISLGEQLSGRPYCDQLDVLRRRKIALWDVVGSARRHGSLDQAMRDVQARELPQFVSGLPLLRAVAFNGTTAAAIGRRQLTGSGLMLLDLPSSSPAYTLPFAAKAERWAALRTFVID